MDTQLENNKRIARNTFFLYLRMIFIMGVSLFTSRVILRALGDVDFGLFNVVGGIIAIFSFCLRFYGGNFFEIYYGRSRGEEIKPSYDVL